MSGIKSICVINFLGNTSNWEERSKNILARGKRKSYKNLFTGEFDSEPALRAFIHRMTALAEKEFYCLNVMVVNWRDEVRYEEIRLEVRAGGASL